MKWTPGDQQQEEQQGEGSGQAGGSVGAGVRVPYALKSNFRQGTTTTMKGQWSWPVPL